MTDFAVNLIRVVNELQDKLNPLVADNLAFDLPQIAVIGGQSSGKSSVLESFVGRDFLPRGSGVVTRRPLVLQLINCKNEAKSFGEFLHIPGKRFYDFEEIRDEITNETDREIKNSYGISSKPINLKIYSSEVLDLTLIDLPGMTRIAVGNQPKDIETRIENMILEYIEKETCLILAVTAANQDLATSDALKLAEKVDPEGKRTIGVLTKLDLMDKGTNARDILMGKLLPLKLGYIGVVNRSQKDIDDKKDMKKALEDELDFFNKHPAYRDMSQRLGIGYLQKYLHKELSKHIFKLLPPLKQKFESEVFEINRNLERIHFPNDTIDKEMIVSESHQQFSQYFKSALLGEGTDIDLTKLSGGAKIGTIFNKTFAKNINELVYDEKQMNHNISTAIQNSFGIYYELFIPNTAIKAVIRNQIETFREPSLCCVDSITREIEDIVEESVCKIQNIPNLRQLFEKLSLDCVRKCKTKCCETVLNFIKAEKSYINLSIINNDLIKAKNSIESAKSMSISSSEDKQLVSTYVVIDNSTSGWIRYQGDNFWFVLVEKTLTWFKDKEKTDQKGSVDLKDAEFKYFPKDFKIVLVLLQKNATTTEMELQFGKSSSAEHWRQWFEKLGVKPYFTQCTTEANQSSVNMSSNDNELEYPEHLRPQVKLMKELVDKHLIVMKDKFKEQIPKICTLELIDSMVNFVEVELIPQIRQSIGSVDEIIGEDPFKGLRTELTERKKHYSEAIEIIDRFARHN